MRGWLAPGLMVEVHMLSNCDHEWTQWSGKQRCRKCGATQ